MTVDVYKRQDHERATCFSMLQRITGFERHLEYSISKGKGEVGIRWSHVADTQRVDSVCRSPQFRTHRQTEQTL